MNRVTADEMRAVPQSRVMSIDFLFDDFDRLIQSPESVHRLRRFILDLAVRGKLVPQDPNDDHASELLKRIASEKARLVKAGEIKKQKRVARFEEAEPTFELPSGWFPTKLALVAVCLDYMRKPVNGTERKRRIAGKSRSQLFPYFGATQQQGWIDEYIFDEELVLLGEDGVPFFDSLRPKAYLISGKSWVNNHAHVFRGILVSNAYLVHYLNVFDYSGRVVGATRSKLNQAKAVDIPVMLPPVAEQHRIVAKVNELMALCDRLEAARAEREATRDRLATASLARLNVPDPDPAMFQHDVAFALNNLTPLTTRPDQIKALRQTILNLAVRGKLVPQDPNDEPASELVKRAKIKDPGAGAFELPASWTWANVGAVADSRLGKMLDKAKNKGKPRRYLRNINVRWFDFDLSDLLEMRFEDSELPEFALRFGDVMICEGGEPGRAAVWDARETDIYFQKAIHRVRFLGFVDSNYFVRALRASADDERLAEYFTGTGIKHFTGKGLAAYSFPLPPLAEQHRIVAKVDELMTLCDRLEANLSTGDETQGRLVEAVLHKLLSGDKINASWPGVGICRNRGEND